MLLIVTAIASTALENHNIRLYVIRWPFPIRRLRECLTSSYDYFESELWTFVHCPWLGQERTKYAVWFSTFPWVPPEGMESKMHCFMTGKIIVLHIYIIIWLEVWNFGCLWLGHERRVHSVCFITVIICVISIFLWWIYWQYHFPTWQMFLMTGYCWPVHLQ